VTINNEADYFTARLKLSGSSHWNSRFRQSETHQWPKCRLLACLCYNIDHVVLFKHCLGCVETRQTRYSSIYRNCLPQPRNPRSRQCVSHIITVFVSQRSHITH
jgi:hypothetical protein